MIQSTSKRDTKLEIFLGPRKPSGLHNSYAYILFCLMTKWKQFSTLFKGERPMAWECTMLTSSGGFFLRGFGRGWVSQSIRSFISRAWSAEVAYLTLFRKIKEWRSRAQGGLGVRVLQTGSVLRFGQREHQRAVCWHGRDGSTLSLEIYFDSSMCFIFQTGNNENIQNNQNHPLWSQDQKGPFPHFFPFS